VTPTISVLHATMGRPAKAFARMLEWMNKADDPSHIEYIMGTHHDDPTAQELFRLLDTQWDVKWCRISAPITHAKGSAANCDNCYNNSRGLLLLNAADDCEPEINWDRRLIDRLTYTAGVDWMHKAIFLAVSDGYRKDRLCTMSIETRKYSEMKGEFLHAGYPGIFSDDEATYRAYRDAKDGKIMLIEDKGIVFRHAHHYNDKSVPWDETYAHQNRPEAYTSGLKLFNERNPRAATDGIRTW
jgi:hypothetical protein